MADETKKYIIDASQAIKSVQSLSREIAIYNKNIQDNVRVNRLQLQTSQQTINLVKQELVAVQAIRLGYQNTQSNVQSLTNAFAQKNQTLQSQINLTKQEITVINNYNTSINNTNNSIRILTNNFNKLSTSLTQTNPNLQKNSTLLGENFTRVASITTFFEIFFRVRSLIEDSLKSAVNFSIAIAEIQTLSQDAGKSFETWGNELRVLQERFGIDRIEAARGVYEALSNQITTAANATGFLAEQQRLASTTTATIDEATQATTAILNAYNLGIEETRRINNLLFATVDRGRTKLSDLSDSIGRVAVITAELNISEEELLASLALLTRRGITTSEAITFIRSAALKLIKPSEALKDAFQRIGVESGTAAVQSFGFFGTLNRLANDAKVQGDFLENLGESINQVRGLIATLALTTGDANKELELLRKSAATADEAFKITNESTGREYLKTLQKIKAEAQELADNVLVNFVASMGSVNDIFLDFTGKGILTNTVNGFFILSGGLLAVSSASNTTRASLLALFTTLKNPLFIIGALGTATILASKDLQRFNTELKETADRAKSLQDQLNFEIFQASLAKSNLITKSLDDSLKGSIRDLSSYTAFIRAENNKVLDNYEETYKRLGKILNDHYEKLFRDSDNSINAFETAIERQKRAVENLKDTLDTRRRDEDIRAFETRLTGLPEQDQFIELNNLRKQLQQQGFEELEKNNLEQSQKLFKDSDEIYRRLVSDFKQNLKEASELVNIKATQEFIGVNSLTGRFSARRAKFLIGQEQKDAELAKSILEQINKLEEQRTEEIKTRTKLEEAAIQRKEVEIQQLQRQKEGQESALENLKETFRNIDKFKGTSEEFVNLTNNAGNLAKQAGFTPEARLRLEQDLFEQLKVLREKDNVDKANKELEQVQRAIENGKAEIDALRNRLNEAKKLKNEETSNFISESAKQLAAYEGLIDNLVKFNPNINNDTAFGDKFAKFPEQEVLKNNLQLVEQTINTYNKFGQISPAAIGRVTEALQRTNQFLKENADLLKIQSDSVAAKFLPVPLKDFNAKEILKDEQNTEGLLDFENKLNKARQGINLNLSQEIQSLQEQEKVLIDRFKNLQNSLPQTAKNFAEQSEIVRDNYQQVNVTLDQIVSKLNNLSKLKFNISIGSPQDGTFGQGFAFGSRGVDNIPALLRRGEVVLNKSASKILGPSIQASQTPSFSSNVNNFNFGNTNISMNSGGNKDQVKSLVETFQKAVRLGLLKL